MAEALPAKPAFAVTSTARRMRTSRLVAYYVLVFLFMLLMSMLLDQLGARFAVHRLGKIDRLIHEAFSFSLNFDAVVQALFSLFLSLLFAMPVAWVYIVTRGEDHFDPAVVHTIVVLCMAVTAVMIVIDNELSRAFSLAGVVAAVRFRNTLDDARDAVYLLIAVAVGMACGTRLYHIAVWLGLAISAVLLLLWKLDFGRTSRPGDPAGPEGGRKKKGGWEPPLSEEARRRIEEAAEQQQRLAQWASMVQNGGKKANAALVVGALDPSRAQDEVDGVLSTHGGGWRLASVSSDGKGNATLEYIGRLPKGTSAGELLQALRRRPGASVGLVAFHSLKGLRPLRGPDGGNG